MVLRTGMSPPRAIREEGEEWPQNPVAGRDNLRGYLKLESAYLRQLLICHGKSGAWASEVPEGGSGRALLMGLSV